MNYYYLLLGFVTGFLFEIAVDRSYGRNVRFVSGYLSLCLFMYAIALGIA